MSSINFNSHPFFKHVRLFREQDEEHNKEVTEEKKEQSKTPEPKTMAKQEEIVSVDNIPTCNFTNGVTINYSQKSDNSQEEPENALDFGDHTDSTGDKPASSFEQGSAMSIEAQVVADVDTPNDANNVFANNMEDSWKSFNIETAEPEPERNVLPEGVPAGAIEVEDGVYEFHVWDEMQDRELIAEYKLNPDTNTLETGVYTFDGNKRVDLDKFDSSIPEVIRETIPVSKNENQNTELPDYYSFKPSDPYNPDILNPQSATTEPEGNLTEQGVQSKQAEQTDKTSDGYMSFKDFIENNPTIPSYAVLNAYNSYLNAMYKPQAPVDNNQNDGAQQNEGTYTGEVVRDANGNTYWIEKTENGTKTTQVMSDGREHIVEKDSDGNVVKVTDLYADGRVDEYVKNDKGDLELQKTYTMKDDDDSPNAGSNTKPPRTFATNETTTIKDSEGNITNQFLEHFEFNENGEKLKTGESIMDKNGNVTAYVEYIRDGNGNVIRTDTYETDENGNVIETRRDADGNETVTVTRKNNNSQNNRTTSSSVSNNNYYNNYGRIGGTSIGLGDMGFDDVFGNTGFSSGKSLDLFGNWVQNSFGGNTSGMILGGQDYTIRGGGSGGSHY